MGWGGLAGAEILMHHRFLPLNSTVCFYRYSKTMPYFNICLLPKKSKRFKVNLYGLGVNSQAAQGLG